MEVLIIDNSSEIISRLTEMLSDLDTIKAIHEARNCKEALIQVKRNKPGIILLDINLPQNESFNCLAKIKTFYKPTAIIALSNRSDKIDEYQYRLQGVEYFFDKYHEFEKIPEAIQLITKKSK